MSLSGLQTAFEMLLLAALPALGPFLAVCLIALAVWAYALIARQSVRAWAGWIMVFLCGALALFCALWLTPALNSIA